MGEVKMIGRRSEIEADLTYISDVAGKVPELPLSPHYGAGLKIAFGYLVVDIAKRALTEQEAKLLQADIHILRQKEFMIKLLDTDASRVRLSHLFAACLNMLNPCYIPQLQDLYYYHSQILQVAVKKNDSDFDSCRKLVREYVKKILTKAVRFNNSPAYLLRDSSTVYSEPGRPCIIVSSCCFVNGSPIYRHHRITFKDRRWYTTAMQWIPYKSLAEAVDWSAPVGATSVMSLTPRELKGYFTSVSNGTNYSFDRVIRLSASASPQPRRKLLN